MDRVEQKPFATREEDNEEHIIFMHSQTQTIFDLPQSLVLWLRDEDSPCLCGKSMKLQSKQDHLLAHCSINKKHTLYKVGRSLIAKVQSQHKAHGFKVEQIGQTAAQSLSQRYM